MIVVDANIIIYYAVAGPLTASVGELIRKDADWRTSALWRYEFTNALTGMVRAKMLGESEAGDAIARAISLMSPREQDVDQGAALHAALRFTLSAYDAQYVALAEMLGVCCITADKSLARRATPITASLIEFIR